MIRNALMACAAMSLAFAPAAAQAQSAQKQAANAPKIERLAQPASKKASKLEGENGILIAVLAAAAVIAGIIIIADDDDPTSP